MKKPLLFFSLYVLHFTAGAQSLPAAWQPKYKFLSAGTSVYGVWRVAAEVQTGNGFSCSLYTSARQRAAANTPDDFYNVRVFRSTRRSVQERLSVYGVTFGKTWWLDQNHQRRFHLKGGLTYNTWRQPVNFRTPAGLYLWTNYDYDQQKLHGRGYVFQPTLEFLPGRCCGFSLSWYTHYNPYWRYSGVEAAILLGYVRDRRAGVQ